MRKNKTYEQQKKFYDRNNDYESLGAIFLNWLEWGQRDRSRHARDLQGRHKGMQEIHFGRPPPPLRQETILSAYQNLLLWQ